ncbi:MAG: glycoside hydrolase family 18 [Bacteroides sp.]|nr:glycoside hydrolase family 18 [Bacteroides sp.]
MKNIKYILLLLFIPFISCDDWTENETVNVQFPIERGEEYFRDLRAYKSIMSERQIAFGWFGGWTAKGPSMVSRLKAIPDSVDIVSIWGRYNNLDDIQKADLKYVQEVLGTKVTYTIFAHEVPEPFEATTEGVQLYAKALADTMYKYNYDGIDLDYEPGFGGVGPLVGHDNELMRDFVLGLSEYFGPASGTGKLLLIDGVPYAVHRELAELFDYGIVQAYASYGDTDLQNRFNSALNKGWKPEQYVFAENFESYWRTGGTSSYEHKDKNGETIVMNSLKGMALFHPMVDGKRMRKGGCGTYHMEYEYAHPDLDYRYLREAVQIMNPAVR